MQENVTQNSELKLLQSKKKIFNIKVPLSVKNREKNYLKTKQNEELSVFLNTTTKRRINFCDMKCTFFLVHFFILLNSIEIALKIVEREC